MRVERIGEAMLHFTYLEQPPARYTFEMPRLRKWVEDWCIGRVLNLFAGKTRLSLDEIRVDLSGEFTPDYQMDAYDFLMMWKGKLFNTIIFDPPYNLRKSREKYEERYIMGRATKIKCELPRVLESGGRIISFGYDTVGMAAKRGFQKLAICLICHGGDHNDTIGLVETYVQSGLPGIEPGPEGRGHRTQTRIHGADPQADCRGSGAGEVAMRGKR